MDATLGAAAETVIREVILLPAGLTLGIIFKVTSLCNRVVVDGVLVMEV